METHPASGRPGGKRGRRRSARTAAQPLTISVIEAGRKYLGLGKHASYRAAARGEIPAIRIGGIMRVPVAAMERLLDRRSTLEDIR
jgi:excisionase family DNA binding protein